MIPKTAHFYWHGEEALPKLRQESVDSFKRMNPSWQSFVHHSGDASDPLWKRIVKSDAARYGILHRAGGIYFDTDIIFIRPIPDIWLDSDLILPSTPEGSMYGVHVLGGEEGSPFFKRAMDLVNARMQSPRVLGCQSLGVKLWEGMDVLGLAGSANLNVRRVPIDAFLLTQWRDVEDIWSKGSISESAIGLHWYGGDPVSMFYQDHDYESLPESMVKTAAEMSRAE